jgi:DNA-binding SARP family transcriptional activator/tetratricopeptide (TPR) repeat protein
VAVGSRTGELAALGVTIDLLGTVEVRAGGTPVPTGSPNQCALLAALAMDADRVVNGGTLVHRVWGPDAPDRAARTLQTYISRIRRMFDDLVTTGSQPATLIRERGGYLLRLEPDRVDVHRFRRLVRAARPPQAARTAQVSAAQVSAGAEQARLTGLREALGLFRGEPLGGVTGSWAEETRQALRREQVDATVTWARAEVGCGEPAAVIAPVRALLVRHPLVEPLAAVLMRALTVLDRQAEALECHAILRRVLAEELGADPGPEVRAAHRAALAAGRVRQPTATVALGGDATSAVPAQLPADIPGFRGRCSELRELDCLVAAPGDHGGTSIVAVSGTAGVGKTALAVHWAHRRRAHFPDGQLYVNLRGFDPTDQAVDPHTVLRDLLHALGVPQHRIPTGPDAQLGLYRSLLDRKRLLVMLDNARDAEQVRPLVPAATGCRTVVTSRNQLLGLVAADGAAPLPLALPSTAEAVSMLAARLAAGRLTTEPGMAERIVTRCARLPLAVGIVAAQAACRPTAGLAELAEGLTAAEDRLDTLDTGDPATRLRSVFSWSYATLSPAAAELFRLLGVHCGPDWTVRAAAALTGQRPGRVGTLLAELEQASLLTRSDSGRYTMHDLLRGYTVELVRNVEPSARRSAAMHRLADHYLHGACAAARCLHPRRTPLVLDHPADGAVPDHPTCQAEALAWFDAERQVLLALLRRAVDERLDRHAWRLAWALDPFLYRRGHLAELAAAWQLALVSADRLGDPVAGVWAHRGLGHALTRFGHHDAARAHLERAVALGAETGDPVDTAHSHNTLAMAYERAGDLRRARAAAAGALRLFTAAGDRRGQALASNSVGWYDALLGEHDAALARCEQALRLLDDLDDRFGAANTCDSLGFIHHQLGDWPRAEAANRRAVALFREVGDRLCEAQSLTRLGDTQQAAGRPERARDSWRAALTILTELDHPDAAAVRDRIRDPATAVRG